MWCSDGGCCRDDGSGDCAGIACKGVVSAAAVMMAVGPVQTVLSFAGSIVACDEVMGAADVMMWWGSCRRCCPLMGALLQVLNLGRVQDVYCLVVVRGARRASAAYG
jgi:hypothetical protein